MALKPMSIEEQMGETPNKVYSLYGGAVKLTYNDADHKYFIDVPEGRIHVPNVTTILKVIGKSDVLISWAVKECVGYIRAEFEKRRASPTTFCALMETDLEQILSGGKSAHRAKKKDAADIGHIAHEWLEKYGARRIHGRSHSVAVAESMPFPENDKARLCVNSALDWIVEHHVEPLEVERKIYSREYHYAGTLDWKGFVDGKLSILDFKSSKYLYDEYRLQVASYQSAVEEEDGCKIEQRILLRLGKEDGAFEVAIFDDRMEYEADRLAFLSAQDLQQRLEQFQAEYKAKQAAKKAKKG
jgi:hypothetical protein